MIQIKIFVQFLKGCEEFLSGCFSFEEKVQVTKSVLSAIVSAQRTASGYCFDDQSQSG